MTKLSAHYEKIRALPIYGKSKKKIEALLQFLEIEYSPGSIAEHLGMDKLQKEVFLYFVSLLQNYPDCEEQIIAQLSVLERKCEIKLRLIDWNARLFMERDMEKMADGITTFYIPISERDASVEGYLDCKPRSLKEMKEVAQTDKSIMMQVSTWQAESNSEYNVLYLPERIGFDRAQFAVDITEFNYETFKAAKECLQSQSYGDLPRIVVEYIDEDDDNEQTVKLPLPNSINKFRKIEITLDKHTTLLIEKNNSTLQEEGIRRDIYLLKTTVPAPREYPYLGNICNCSCETMKHRVSLVIWKLKKYFGICIEPETVRLNDVEINLTFRQGCKFDDLMQAISYYQLYANANYTTTKYQMPEEAEIYFCNDYSDCATKEEYDRKRRFNMQRCKRIKCTGFMTKAETVVVKIYDKAEETKIYAKKQGVTLEFEGNEALVRLEFKIKNQIQLVRYFPSRDNKNVYLSDLTQKALENTYKELAERFFVYAYEKYAEDSIKTLKNIIRNVTTEHGKKWRQKIIEDIKDQRNFSVTTPAFLSVKDIDDELITLNPIFAKNVPYYKKELKRVLRDSNTFPNSLKNAYDMIYNFLMKTSKLRSLSKKRRVAFWVK